MDPMTVAIDVPDVDGLAGQPPPPYDGRRVGRPKLRLEAGRVALAAIHQPHGERREAVIVGGIEHERRPFERQVHARSLPVAAWRSARLANARL